MDRVAALQPLLVGAILLWSSYGKLFGRTVEVTAQRTALARIVGTPRALPAYRTAGVVEVLIGLCLVAMPPAWPAVAATALTAGFVGYLGYARVAAPDSSCGCLSAKSLPVSWRSLARAGMLLAASGFALTASAGWWSSLSALPFVMAEVVVFGMLSGELDRFWLRPLRRLRVRLTHPLAATTGSFQLPLASTVQQLLKSPAYRAVGTLLRSDVRDHWDDGEWRFLTYAVVYADQPATAVFAVPLLRYEPDAVQVAVVDDRTGETLYKPELLSLAAR